MASPTRIDSRATVAVPAVEAVVGADSVKVGVAEEEEVEAEERAAG